MSSRLSTAGSTVEHVPLGGHTPVVLAPVSAELNNTTGRYEFSIVDPLAGYTTAYLGDSGGTVLQFYATAPTNVRTPISSAAALRVLI